MSGIVNKTTGNWELKVRGLKGYCYKAGSIGKAQLLGEKTS